jgi:hypothetical protein
MTVLLVRPAGELKKRMGSASGADELVGLVSTQQGVAAVRYLHGLNKSSEATFRLNRWLVSTNLRGLRLLD